MAAVTAASGIPAAGQNGRIDQHDVGHGQEGGDAGQNFGAPVGSQVSEFKVAFESLEHRRVLLGNHRQGVVAQRILCDDALMRNLCGEQAVVQQQVGADGGGEAEQDRPDPLEVRGEGVSAFARAHQRYASRRADGEQ